MKTAKEILRSKEFTDDDGVTGWTEESVLKAMEQYADQFREIVSGSLPICKCGSQDIRRKKFGILTCEDCGEVIKNQIPIP